MYRHMAQNKAEHFNEFIPCILEAVPRGSWFPRKQALGQPSVTELFVKAVNGISESRRCLGTKSYTLEKYLMTYEM